MAGEWFSPSRVKRRGISAPFSKVGLNNENVMMSCSPFFCRTYVVAKRVFFPTKFRLEFASKQVALQKPLAMAPFFSRCTVENSPKLPLKLP
jgi:hypothetical protein